MSEKIKFKRVSRNFYISNIEVSKKHKTGYNKVPKYVLHIRDGYGYIFNNKNNRKYYLLPTKKGNIYIRCAKFVNSLENSRTKNKPI